MTVRAPRGRRRGCWGGALRSRRGTDQGAGTVLVLGVVAVLVTVLFGALAVLSAVEAGHRAASAADLAALAGAASLAAESPTERACDRAAAVAAANGAVLVDCVVRGEEVWLATTVSPAFRGLPAATARARAGPAPPAG